MNNRRKLTGDTIFDDDTQYVQRIVVKDQCRMTLLFEFTPDELNSTEEFCKAPFDMVDGEWCFFIDKFQKVFLSRYFLTIL